MGKARRKKHNRKNKYKDRSAARFVSHAQHSTFLEEALSAEERRAAAKGFQEEYVKLEKDFLGRSVYITNVRNLDQQVLNNLTAFLTRNYGPVDKSFLVRTMGSGKNTRNLRYPNARIRFYYKSDAEKIFGGKPLESVRDKVWVACECGMSQKGAIGLSQKKISIMPSEKYPGMIEAERTNDPIFEFECSSLALGHWIPPELDFYKYWYEDTESNNYNEWRNYTVEWLEETVVNQTVKLQVNLSTRTASLLMTCAEEDRSFLFSTGSKTYHASFKFKALMDPIDLCRDINKSRGYSLAFSLRYPPKLEVSSRNLLLEALGDDRYSASVIPSLCFGPVPGKTFGRCLGFRVNISEGEATRLIDNGSMLKRLTDSGIVFDDLTSLYNTRAISTTMILYSSMEATLLQCLKRTHNRNERIGKDVYVMA
jgi:hypothetical protein